MICPSCGFEVDGQATVCPYCDADLTVTSPLHAANAGWCPACGTLVGPDDKVCPRCGAECTGISVVKQTQKSMDDSVRKTVLSSAIPLEGEEDIAPVPAPAPVSRYVAAIAVGVCALVVLVLMVLQPWADRGAAPERTQPIPSSSSPQVINALSGQDFRESTATRLGAQGERSTIEWAEDGYEITIGLAARLKSNWGLLTQVADGTVTQGLDVGRDEAAAILAEASTLYGDIAGAPEDEGYLTEVSRLMNLVEWLKASSQGVLDGWDAAMSNDVPDRAEAIETALEEAGVEEASSEFVAQFEEWEPAK